MGAESKPPCFTTPYWVLTGFSSRCLQWWLSWCLMGNGVCWVDSRPSLEGCSALWLVSVTWVSVTCHNTHLSGHLVSCLCSYWTSLFPVCLWFSGETVEETVNREVAEEVGLEVHSISYSSSQHWPFPHSSFMLGCHASVSPAHTQVS